MKTEIFDLLNKIEQYGYEAFVVGGYVRDQLLGKYTNDIDICTNASPKELKKIFPNLIYNNFYCSTLKLNNLNVEITTYRKESNYDGRKPLNIELIDTLEEDLKRRDFTINAICLDKNGKYINLINGIDDLNNKLIKVIGDSDKKLKEDSLRILRAIRFATVLDFKLDNNLKDSISKNASNVKNLSNYRIKSELDKILKSKNFKYGIDLIKQFSLDKYLNISFPNNINYCNDLIGMYIQIDVKIEKFFSKNELRIINKLKPYLNKELDIYDLYKIGLEDIKVLSEIKSQNLTEKYNKLYIKNERELKICFNDVKEILKNKKINFNDIKTLIIKEILSGNIKNEKEEIINFITNK